jgi:tetratricopeptide (TPR) repeat protein
MKAQDAGLVKEGDSAFAKGDYDAARRSFERALQASADSSARYEILKRLTSTSAALGQFAEAQRYLQQAMTVLADPKLEDLLLSVNLDMRTKEFARALATAQRVEAMHVATYTSESLPVADDLLRSSRGPWFAGSGERRVDRRDQKGSGRAPELDGKIVACAARPVSSILPASQAGA